MNFSFTSPTTTAPPAFGSTTQSSSFNFSAGDAASKQAFSFGAGAAANKPGGFSFGSPATTTAAHSFNLSAISSPNFSFGTPKTTVQNSLLLGSSPATTGASGQFQLGGGTGLFNSSPSTGINFGSPTVVPAAAAQPALGFGTATSQPQYGYGLGSTTAASALPAFGSPAMATTQAATAGFSFGSPQGGLPGFAPPAKPIASQASTGLTFGSLPGFGSQNQPALPVQSAQMGQPLAAAVATPAPTYALGQNAAAPTPAGFQFGQSTVPSGAAPSFGQTTSSYPLAKPIAGVAQPTPAQTSVPQQTPLFGITAAKPALSVAPTPAFQLPSATSISIAASSAPPSFPFAASAFTPASSIQPQLGATTIATAPSTTFQLGAPTTSAPAFPLGSAIAGAGSSTVAGLAPAAGFQLGTATSTTATGFQLGAATSAPSTGFQLGTATSAPATAFQLGTPATAPAPGLQLGSLAPKSTAPAPQSTATFSLPGVSSAPSVIGGITATAASLPTSMAAPLAGSLVGAFQPSATSGATATIGASLTTSTVTTSALPQQPSVISSMSFSQLEEMMNKWTLDLEEQEKVFINQATQVNAWDRVLISNGEKIVQLNEGIENAEAEHSNLVHELDFVLAQQKELDELLIPLEKELANVSVVDPEREQMYNMAENIDTQLKYMSEDLKEVIDHLNESNRNQDANDPIVHIGRILNAHMSSMQWIDTSTAQISAKLDQLSALRTALRRDNERTFHLTYN